MKFDTSTLTSKNEIVPWLAAKGELAYSPFNPPDRDYFFLYNFILSKIFHEKVNLKKYYWFGSYADKSDYNVKALLNFWQNARNGNIFPVFVRNAPENLGEFVAPIAIFKLDRLLMGRNEPHYLLMQHGSYLIIPVQEQPLLELGFVLLHRGIGSSNKFNAFQMPRNATLIKLYRGITLKLFSNSVKSFNVAHASVLRCETGHLLSRKNIFGIKSSDNQTENRNLTKLLQVTEQCYTLKKELAKNKFGPSYVTFKTPITNIRICTFFTGEYEARILSLDNVMPTEAVKCEFVVKEF